MSSDIVTMMGRFPFLRDIQLALGETHNLDRCCSSAPVHARVVFKKNIFWMIDIMNTALHFLILILRLTAYVAKVFAMAKSLVVIDSSVICNAVSYLIHQTQNSDGSFREVGKVYSDGMNVRKDSPDTRSDQHYAITALYPGHTQGDVGGKDADVSMTAFCLIALQESYSLCHKDISVSLTMRDLTAILMLQMKHNGARISRLKPMTANGQMRRVAASPTRFFPCRVCQTVFTER